MKNLNIEKIQKKNITDYELIAHKKRTNRPQKTRLVRDHERM